MANIDLGGLRPGQSFDSLSQKINGADADTKIGAYCTMENNSSTNKVGRITVSTNFDGGNLNVAVGSSYGATDGASGTVRRGSSFSCYVSYLERSNYIVITVPQEIREEFTVEIAFSALTGREATFEVEQGLVYNGSLQYGIINLSNCSVASGAISGTDPGTYNCTLKADSSEKYSACYYFNDNGVAQSLKSAVWTISKALPNWSIAPATTNIKIGETGRVIISGTFTGIDSVQQSSPDGGEVSFLGLNGNQYSFKGTKAGTVAVIVYSKENQYYESDNRVFRVIVSEKEDQNWYYENTSVTVGNTAYIYRQYQSGGNKVSTKTPSVTGWDSSIISATIYNDGRIAIEGKQIGTSSLTISIDGDDNYKNKSDIITVTVVDKQDQNWTFQNIPSEMNVGDSKNALFDGGASSSNFSSIRVITSPVGIINTSLSTDKKTITLEALNAGTCELTITVPGDSSYKNKTQTASITVKKNSQNVAIPNVEVTVDGTEKIIYEHGYSPASGNPTFKIRPGDEQYISINSEKPPTVTGKKVGSAIIYFNDAGNHAYEKVENYPIEVTVTEDAREEQDWAFSSPQDIELGQTLEVVHTGGTIWGEVNVGVEDVTLLEASYNSSTAKLTITANNTISGTTSIKVEAAGNEYFKPWSQNIEININKHKQTWTLNPSEVAIEIGESANIEVEGEMFGSTNTYVPPAKIYMDVEPHFGETPPYFTITGKQTINRGQLTVSSTESTTYEDRTQTAYITVGAKKDQTWEANISETTIKISEFVDISVFGSIYGGLYFSTDSSLITIINKTDSGCRVVAGNSTGTAKVRLYSPGTTAYNSKEVYITIHIKDDLIWVECNPHIYKNGKWIEMSPKIYKNGKWLSGIIKKYISKGDIYGK